MEALLGHYGCFPGGRATNRRAVFLNATVNSGDLLQLARTTLAASGPAWPEQPLPPADATSVAPRSPHEVPGLEGDQPRQHGHGTDCKR